MADNRVCTSLVCQPIHRQKEVCVPRGTFLWRGGVNVQTNIRYALLTSENMDCTEADTKQRRTVAARCSKQGSKMLGYSAPMWPLLRRMIEHIELQCIFSFMLCMQFVCVLLFDWCNW